MACNSNTTCTTNTCSNTTCNCERRGGRGYIIIIVLYILLAIILGSYIM